MTPDNNPPPDPSVEEEAAAKAAVEAEAKVKAAAATAPVKDDGTPPEIARLGDLINRSELAGDEGETPPAQKPEGEGEGGEGEGEGTPKLTDEQVLEALTESPDLRRKVMSTPETEKGINAIVDDLLNTREVERKKVADVKQITSTLREARLKGDESGDYGAYFALRDNLDRRTAIQRLVKDASGKEATKATYTTFDAAIRTAFPEEYNALTPEEFQALNVANYPNAEEALAVQMSYLAWKRMDRLGVAGQAEVDERDGAAENERVAAKAAEAQGGLPSGSPASAATDDIGALVRKGIGWAPGTDDSD